MAAMPRCFSAPRTLVQLTFRTSFVVEDERYNYITARYPVDADLFAEKIINPVQSLK